MTILIYLDESGDLGWSFSAPYRHGGSSRYLTIAAILTPDAKKHLPNRVIRDLYTERNWSTGKEKKWSDMSDSARAAFVDKAIKLKAKHPDICYFAIVVKKSNVQPHIRTDANLLYNYMIRLLLLDEMKNHDNVILVPDPRTIKIERGSSLHDYMQTQLWFCENSATILTTEPQDSKKSLSLQFADMLSGAVQSHFEDSRSDPLNGLRAHVNLKRLFF